MASYILFRKEYLYKGIALTEHITFLLFSPEKGEIVKTVNFIKSDRLEIQAFKCDIVEKFGDDLQIVSATYENDRLIKTVNPDNLSPETINHILNAEDIAVGC